MKCRNLSGGEGIYPYYGEYFPRAENLELLFFFCSTVFVDKIIRGNMIYSLFYQLVDVGKYLPQKGNFLENNSCFTALGFIEDLYVFRQIFPHISCYFHLPTNVIQTMLRE